MCSKIQIPIHNHDWCKKKVFLILKLIGFKELERIMNITVIIVEIIIIYIIHNWHFKPCYIHKNVMYIILILYDALRILMQWMGGFNVAYGLILSIKNIIKSYE